MATCIKAKLKKSDDEMNIYRYRVYNRKLSYIFKIGIPNFY